MGSSDSAILVVQPTDSIQWVKDNMAISGANKTRYKVNQSGAYYALLFNSKGCSTGTYKKTILIEKPIPAITYPVQYAIINMPQQLQARTFGVSVEWNPPTYLDNSTSLTPVFTGQTDKLYTVAIKTSAGCLTVDTQLVKAFKEVKIYVPTAFTPNNDGLNDFLKPIPAGIKQFSFFRVYNWWEQLVFDLKSDPRGWDGTINGKPQSTQTVVWMTEGIGADNKIYKQKGTCVLIR
jgi:gliding motility-associated-like protein